MDGLIDNRSACMHACLFVCMHALSCLIVVSEVFSPWHANASANP